MKNLILIITTALALCLPVAAQAQHTKSAKHTSVADTSSIVAYSDTTANDTAAVHHSYKKVNPYDEDISFKDIDKDPFSLIAYLTSVSTGGIIVAIFFVLLCIITILSPVILVAVILYLVFKRKKDRYRVIEKAMENGQPVPDDMNKNYLESNEVLWRKGVRNFFVGLGLIAVFLSLSIESLIGVGVLVALYGAGQAVIAKTSAKKEDKNDDDRNL